MWYRYVDSVLGAGRDKELFYTDPAVRAAYRLWVQTLAQRVNTVNGWDFEISPGSRRDLAIQHEGASGCPSRKFATIPNRWGS